MASSDLIGDAGDFCFSLLSSPRPCFFFAPWRSILSDPVRSFVVLVVPIEAIFNRILLEVGECKSL